MNFLAHLSDQLTQIVLLTQQHLPLLGYILIIFWSVFILNALTGRHLSMLGIIPRRLYGLPGVVFAPFLHANTTHLFFNCIPLVVLSNFILFNGLHYYLMVTAVITVGSGLLIWCFAKPGLHLGASAVITGYWGLLVCQSYQTPTLLSVFLGLICLYYFIGIFYAVFPAKKGISWEGHLFGLVTGVGLCLIMNHNLIHS